MPVNTNEATDWEVGAKAVYLLDPDTGNPVGSLTLPLETRLPCWHYVGGERLVCNGSVLANVPAEATAFVIASRGGAVYYDVNGLTASANSPGYVAEDGVQTVGPLSNLVRLAVFGGGATVYAHLQYFREA